MKLYEYAERAVPDWFPRSPAEEISPPVVDLLAEYLTPRRKGLRRVPKVTKKHIEGRVHLDFGQRADDKELWRLRDGLRRAALGSFHVQKSTTEVIVAPADEFDRWMEQMGLGEFV